MADKTDKTDTKVRSCWWSITAYNDEIEVLEKPPFPHFIKTVYGGREVCPTTGRLHFQGAIQTDYVRFSQIKNWLPTAHIEPARDKKALQRYVLKSETAVGEKGVKVNPGAGRLAHDILKYIARAELVQKMSNPTVWGLLPGPQEQFDATINFMLRREPELAGQLMNPSLRNFYIRTKDSWLFHAAAEGIVLPEGGGPSVLHDEPDVDNDSGSEGRPEGYD